MVQAVIWLVLDGKNKCSELFPTKEVVCGVLIGETGLAEVLSRVLASVSIRELSLWRSRYTRTAALVLDP